MFGKLDGKFTCQIEGEDFVTRGDTKEAAELAMKQKILLQDQNCWVRRYLRGTNSTWCLFYAGGWTYDIISDYSPERPSSCMLSCRTQTEAMAAMKAHFSQYHPETVSGTKPNI